MNTSSLLSALIVVHFAYHLIGTIGTFYALWHSNKVHKRSWWKLCAAIIWVIVSLAIWLLLPFDTGHC